MKTRLLLFFILMLVSVAGFALTKDVWDEGTAVADARTLFDKDGYKPITIVDAKGKLYYGENRLPEDIVDCALDRVEIKLHVYKVTSLTDKNMRAYVIKHNTEMVRLLAIDKDCLDE